jgi:hypothetical protein
MRKRTLGAIVLAGLAVSGAGAFTASNTVADSVAGYGTANVTGVTVSNTAYTLNATDSSKVTAMTFTTAQSLVGKSVVLQLTNGGSNVTAASTCVGGALTTACTFTTVGGVAIASFDGFGLTVHQ